MISVVITSYNEGDEVAATIESVRRNTEESTEIILVDDGSTDGSCDNTSADIRIRNEDRIGICYSRNLGSDASHGDVIIYLDAHQRAEEKCFDALAQVARTYRCIVWAPIRGLEDKGWTGHGAYLRQHRTDNKRGLFESRWNRKEPRDYLSRFSSMVCPGYAMSRRVFFDVRWIDGLIGWGCSEQAISLKAFFLDIDILHVKGPVCRHMFRSGHFPYDTKWKKVAVNHAMVARVCFDEQTWDDYWWPKVFERHRIGTDWITDSIEEQRREFAQRKKRPDSEFWRGLLKKAQ